MRARFRRSLSKIGEDAAFFELILGLEMAAESYARGNEVFSGAGQGEPRVLGLQEKARCITASWSLLEGRVLGSEDQ